MVRPSIPAEAILFDRVEDEEEVDNNGGCSCCCCCCRVEVFKPAGVITSVTLVEVTLVVDVGGEFPFDAEISSRCLRILSAVRRDSVGLTSECWVWVKNTVSFGVFM